MMAYQFLIKLEIVLVDKDDTSVNLRYDTAIRTRDSLCL
jgi:hypothetical protein